VVYHQTLNRHVWGWRISENLEETRRRCMSKMWQLGRCNPCMNLPRSFKPGYLGSKAYGIERMAYKKGDPDLTLVIISSL